MSTTDSSTPLTSASAPNLRGLLGCLHRLSSDRLPADGVAADTVRHAYSAWRTVAKRLGLPADATVDELDLDDLLLRFADDARHRGQHFKSTATYLTRLRRGLELYRRYRTGELSRRGPTAIRLPEGTETISLQLRPDVALMIALPPDVRLEPDEIDLITRWLTGYACHQTGER